MDKTEGNKCPRCGEPTLSVYYEDGADLQLGAHCETCGLKGIFVNNKLIQLATS